MKELTKILENFKDIESKWENCGFKLNRELKMVKKISNKYEELGKIQLEVYNSYHLLQQTAAKYGEGSEAEIAASNKHASFCNKRDRLQNALLFNKDFSHSENEIRSQKYKELGELQIRTWIAWNIWQTALKEDGKDSSQEKIANNRYISYRKMHDTLEMSLMTTHSGDFNDG